MSTRSFYIPNIKTLGNDFRQEVFTMFSPIDIKKIVSEYDQEMPQSQTVDNPIAPRERAA